jgi:hypothetical protein
MWALADTENVATTGFKLEAMGRGSIFQEIPGCGSSPLVYSCTEPMETFLGPPFYRLPGDPIVVRGTARSDEGWGAMSDQASEEDVVVVTAPTRPSLDSEVNQQSITLTWQDQENALYELLWQEPNTANFEPLVEFSNTRYTVSRLQAGGSYKFKVRAKNLCGESDWSSLRVVRVPDVPA